MSPAFLPLLMVLFATEEKQPKQRGRATAQIPPGEAPPQRVAHAISEQPPDGVIAETTDDGQTWTFRSRGLFSKLSGPPAVDDRRWEIEGRPYQWNGSQFLPLPFHRTTPPGEGVIVGAIDPAAAQRDAQLSNWLHQGNNWWALRFRSGSWTKPMWIDRETIRGWHNYGDVFAYAPPFGGWQPVKSWM